MNKNEICLYPAIFHHGIGRYCQKLIEELELDYIYSKYNYLSPFQLFERINKKYNILHCPHILVNNDMRKNSNAIISTIHDVSPLVLKNFSKIKLIYYKFRIQKTIENSDFLIFDTSAARDDFLNYFEIKIPSRVIHLSSFVKPIKLDYSIERKNFIHVGRRSENKNIIRIIRAFSNVANKIEDNFVLIGNKSPVDDIVLREINKLKMNDRITIIENTSDSELNKYYHKAKCLLFPSLYEGYGLPVIEAINSNCPVIISDIKVFREITNNNAHFVDPYSIDEMSENILKVSTNSNYANMHCLAAFEHVNSRNWTNVAKETQEVYELFE